MAKLTKVANSIAAKLSRLGYYINPAESGGATLYKKTGEKVGFFDYIDDAVNAATSASNAAPESGSIVRAVARKKDDPDLPDMSYRGGHTAPVDPDYHAPLHEMNKIYPDDIYSNRAQQYYGHGDAALDRPSFQVINSAKGQPESKVDMYRAVPLDAADEILPGDWVTTNQKYAHQHGEGLGDYKVLQAQTEAKRLFTDGNSPHEFGYSGKATPEMLAALAGGTALVGGLAAADAEAGVVGKSAKLAAFDPAKKDSANLLAGMGGAAVVGGAALSPEQAKADQEYTTAVTQKLETAIAAHRFMDRRASKGDKWKQKRTEILNTINQYAGGALEALDMPMRGYHGIAATAGSLAAGNSLQDALMRGGTVARQPLEQTAYDLGGAVTDKTGSPALGTAAYLASQMGGPI